MDAMTPLECWELGWACGYGRGTPGVMFAAAERALGRALSGREKQAVRRGFLDGRADWAQDGADRMTMTVAARGEPVPL